MSLHNLATKIIDGMRISESAPPTVQQKVKKKFGVAKDEDYKKYSKYPGESQYVKFWLLNDGSLIYVPFTHIMFGDENTELTEENYDVWYVPLDASGAAKITVNNEEINVYSSSEKLTDDQKSTMIDLYNRYNFDMVNIEYADRFDNFIVKSGGMLRWMLDASPKELVLLQYRESKVNEDYLRGTEATLRIYRGLEHNISPSTEDLDEALLTFLEYTENHTADDSGEYWASSTEEWQEVKKLLIEAHDRVEKALKSTVSDGEKLIALDSVVDVMHNHFYALEQLNWGKGWDRTEEGRNIHRNVIEIIKILRKLGKFPKGVEGIDKPRWRVQHIWDIKTKPKKETTTFDDKESAEKFREAGKLKSDKDDIWFLWHVYDKATESKINEETTMSNISYLPSQLGSVKAMLTDLSKEKPDWNIEMLEDLDPRQFIIKDRATFSVPKEHWTDFLNIFDGHINGKLLKLGGIKESTVISDEFDKYVELQDETDQEVVDEWMENKGNVGAKQSWDLIPSDKLKRIWKDFSESGIVKDDKPILEFQTIIVNNVQRISANTRLMGHDSTGALQDVIERSGVTEKDMEGFEDYCVDSKGNWRISDYAMDKLGTAAIAIMRAKTSEDKLVAIDNVFNIVHQRSDLPGWFVEGGRKTLDELADRPSDPYYGIEESQLFEANEADVKKLRLKLKTSLQQLFHNKEFIKAQWMAWNWYLVFEVSGYTTESAKSVAVSNEKLDRDVQRIYGELLREYGDDRGNLEMLIAALNDKSELNTFAIFKNFDYVFGTRMNSNYEGYELGFELLINFMYESSQSIYVADKELLNKIEEDIPSGIKVANNAIWPIGGVFAKGIFQKIRDVIDDLIIGTEPEQKVKDKKEQK